MLTKQIIRFLPMLTIFLLPCMVVPSVFARTTLLESQLLEYAGKSYSGAQDPSFLNYDSTLREVMVKRIQKQFGISLDAKIYSGSDLLEIEALFRCKKSDEPFDIFLKMFPKRP